MTTPLRSPEGRREPLSENPLGGRPLASFRLLSLRGVFRALLVALPLMLVGSGMAAVGLRELYQREPAARLRSRSTFQPVTPPGATAPPALSSGSGPRGLIAGGLVLVMFSNVLLLGALHRSLSRDRFLLLRGDGIVRQHDDTWTYVGWDEVEGVRYERKDKSVCLLMREGGQWVLRGRHMGIENDALAVLIRDIHRKAIWGLFDRG